MFAYEMSEHREGKGRTEDGGIGRTREQEIIGGMQKGKIICLFNFIVSFII